VTPPAGGTASSILTVTVAGAAAGSYPITITGTSGALIHGATLTVQVVAVGGHCLIATATYGSELSDEVQFLRNFRDKSILKTNTGSNFMVAFNAWYYSFSPYVAQFIREHALARTVTKLMLYPLMGILRLGAAVFYILPTNLEASAVVSGLLVSSLIGTVYLSPPLVAVLVSSLRARRAARRLQVPSVCILLGALAAVAFIATVGAPSILMIFSTATIVLSALAASALYASRVFLRLAGRV
jgi:peptide/nickel transport system substrate-binding protein